MVVLLLVDWFVLHFKALGETKWTHGLILNGPSITQQVSYSSKTLQEHRD